jgi:hypothetical protein
MEKENIRRCCQEMRQMDWMSVIAELLVQAEDLKDNPSVAGMTTHQLLLCLADALSAGLNNNLFDKELDRLFDEQDLDRMRNAMRKPMTEP